MNIIGISSYYHDSACCIIKDGYLSAAVQEERFSRIKSDSQFPTRSFQYCLEETGLDITQIDCIAYYEDPVKKLSRQLWTGLNYLDPANREKMNPHRPIDDIRGKWGFEGKIMFFNHHQSHAASSFFFSGFNSSAILVNDGVGEWTTTSYCHGQNNSIKTLNEVEFPNSIGLLYSAITNYLGYKVNGGEYKVMGLAPYGQPKYIEEIYKIIRFESDGKYKVDTKYFDFTNKHRMYSNDLIFLLSHPPRKADTPLKQFHKDLARSLQVVLEELLIKQVEYLWKITEESNLCLAGGVALNCVANSKILKKTNFKSLFIQPAANDSGCSLGAAALAYSKLTGEKLKTSPLKSVYLGPKYQPEDIEDLLKATKLKYKKLPKNKTKLIKLIAKKLNEGEVIAWFQDRIEFGPRALGNRSILADPRSHTAKFRINKIVKKRESFRPFAPAVIEEKAHKYFNCENPSPFMLETFGVKKPKLFPAITHIDGSARVQTVNKKTNPVFHKLLSEFGQLSGHPVLLNTSFNIRGYPIVCSPSDALICFSATHIDNLVIENFLIERASNTVFAYENLNHRIDNKHHNVYSFI